MTTGWYIRIEILQRKKWEVRGKIWRDQESKLNNVSKKTNDAVKVAVDDNRFARFQIDKLFPPIRDLNEDKKTNA